MSINELEKMHSSLTGDIALNDYQKLLKKGCVTFILEKGADPEIVGMEAIQKLFDIAISAPSSSVGPRVFKYNTVKDDGTFTISTHIKLPIGMMGPNQPVAFEIRRIKNGDQNHFLEVFNDDGVRIIVNQEGKAISIESDKASVSLIPDEGQKGNNKQFIK